MSLKCEPVPPPNVIDMPRIGTSWAHTPSMKFKTITSNATSFQERELLIDNLLVHFIIVMIKWTGLAPREVEFPFPGSLTSTVLASGGMALRRVPGGEMTRIKPPFG